MSSEFREQLVFWMESAPTSKSTNTAKMNILVDLDYVQFIKITSNIFKNHPKIQS